MNLIARSIAALTVLLLIQGPARADTSEAADFVAELGQTAIDTLTGQGVAPQVREAKFRELLSQNFDVPRIGNFVLGQYRRQASEDELTNFYSVFEDTMVATYVGRFEQYSGQGFVVDRTVPDGESGAIVTTSVLTPNGQSARVDWRLRERNGSFVVVDVAIEGVSIAQTLREEYASVLQQNGGTVTGLVAALRARLG